jgi:hypothetical protein
MEDKINVCKVLVGNLRVHNGLEGILTEGRVILLVKWILSWV